MSAIYHAASPCRECLHSAHGVGRPEPPTAAVAADYEAALLLP